MKELPKDFHKQHGLQMLQLTFKFFPKEGLVVSRTQSTVWNTEHTCPAPTCDFILGGSSCSSDSVFELRGAPKVQSGLTPKRPHTCFLYCLPENEELAMEATKEAIKTSVQESLHKLKVLIKQTQCNYDKAFGQ